MPGNYSPVKEKGSHQRCPRKQSDIDFKEKQKNLKDAQRMKRI